MRCFPFTNYHFQTGVTVMGFAEDSGLYAAKGSKLFLETQKRLGKSGIRTHDPQKTQSYIVKCALFDFKFELVMNSIHLYQRL